MIGDQFLVESRYGKTSSEDIIEAIRQARGKVPAKADLARTQLVIYRLRGGKRKLTGLTNAAQEFGRARWNGSIETDEPKTTKVKAHKTTRNIKPPSNGVIGKAKVLVFDHPLTAVCRALGKLGMKPDNAVKAIRAKVSDANESTIRIQVKAGSKGERGEPANLTKEQVAWFRKAGK